MDREFAPTPSEIEQVHLFARECQCAALLFVEAPEPLELLDAIHRIFAACPDAFAAIHMSCVALVLIGFARQVLRFADATSGLDSIPRSTTRERVAQAAARIFAWHTRASLTGREIAASLGVGSAYLSDSINRISHRGFFDHLHAIRILHAAVELAETNDSVAMIAGRVGYSCAPQLVRSFHKILHVTPGRFRTVAAQKMPACRKSQRTSR
jgi:AraC-like DNA-binding protein